MPAWKEHANILEGFEPSTSEEVRWSRSPLRLFFCFDVALLNIALIQNYLKSPWELLFQRTNYLRNEKGEFNLFNFRCFPLVICLPTNKWLSTIYWRSMKGFAMSRPFKTSIINVTQKRFIDYFIRCVYVLDFAHTPWLRPVEESTDHLRSD